ncbi:MAG TPA: hypothetical protein VF546_17590 [Pyrinomonadaceae bacterium]
MSSELQGAIAVLVKRIEQKTQEIAESKRIVNSLCREVGQEPIYPDTDLTVGGFGGLLSVRPSQFYGKAPTVAAREYLELRGEAVALDEILEAFQRGGFDFDAMGWPEGARLRNLGVSLGKNSAMFHRLPNNTWGLTKWYPNAARPKKAANKTEATAQPDTTAQGEPQAKAAQAATTTEASEENGAEAETKGQAT